MFCPHNLASLVAVLMVVTLPIRSGAGTGAGAGVGVGVGAGVGARVGAGAGARVWVAPGFQVHLVRPEVQGAGGAQRYIRSVGAPRVTHYTHTGEPQYSPGFTYTGPARLSPVTHTRVIYGYQKKNRPQPRRTRIRLRRHEHGSWHPRSFTPVTRHRGYHAPIPVPQYHGYGDIMFEPNLYYNKPGLYLPGHANVYEFRFQIPIPLWLHKFEENFFVPLDPDDYVAVAMPYGFTPRGFEFPRDDVFDYLHGRRDFFSPAARGGYRSLKNPDGYTGRRPTHDEVYGVKHESVRAAAVDTW